uniref:Succinate:cytochrome c oxidoreductase subunit 4 n=1 Tax=Asparagopsis taxiformis TaxID=260499 RepID=A0A0E3DBI8_9FLOR|nr:hypothetical protein Atax.mt.29 [Asparagopsis taxiformis]AHX02411.1 hypothetical protein Atax.mt.29 [Asparagopsis taxiformis]
MIKLNLYEISFRLAALLTVPIVLIDVEIYLLVNSLLFLHLKTGLLTILDDYIHRAQIKLILIFFIRILVIEILRYSLELLL